MQSFFLERHLRTVRSSSYTKNYRYKI